MDATLCAALHGSPVAMRAVALLRIAEGLRLATEAEAAFRDAREWLCNESAAGDCLTDAIRGLADTASDAGEAERLAKGSE